MKIENEATHQAWETLQGRFRPYVEDLLRARPSLGPEHAAQTLQFALSRLDEGRQVGSFFLQRAAQSTQSLKVLDIGVGDGGTSVGIANWRRFGVTALELMPNRQLGHLIRRLSVPLRQVAADGARLPFSEDSFDAVLCLEVIEHVPRPEILGAEIMRVLKPGGHCMLTTPARLRFLFGPDPHFGVRGLLLLPDALQRRVVLWLAHRQGLRIQDAAYDVQHIFWHIDGIARLFPGEKSVEGLWNRQTWSPLRDFLWDRIVVTKRPGG